MALSMDDYRKYRGYDKLGCEVRMVVGYILPHAECGPNDHRKDAPLFIKLIFMVDFSMDIVDQQKKYTVVGSYLADNTKHTNVVIHYEANTNCKGNTCLGSKTQDQFDLMIMGLDTVDMGTKVLNDCLVSVRAGHYGAKEDYSVAPADFQLGCVAWTNKYT